MADAAAAVRQCAHCPAVATMTCSRCRNSSYCSADCQKRAWKAHRPACIPVGGLPPAGSAALKRKLPLATDAPPFSTEPARMARMRSLPATARADNLRALTKFLMSGEATPPQSLLSGLAPHGWPDMCDGRGATMLHFAAFRNNSSGTRDLLALGAEVGASSNLVPTPLHVAALCGSIDCMKLLLAAKADPNAMSTFCVANYVGQMGQPTHPLAPFTEVPADRPFVFATGDALCVWTPLHWAALSPHPRGPEAIALLLASGACIDQPGGRVSCGWTPLHLAALMHNPAAVRTLVEAGADVGAVAKVYNQTPLLSAVTWSWMSDRQPLASHMDRMNVGGGQEFFGGGVFRNAASTAELMSVCSPLIAAGSDPTLKLPASEAGGPGRAPESPCDALESRGKGEVAAALRTLWDQRRRARRQ